MSELDWRTDCKSLREIFILDNTFCVLDWFPPGERTITNIDFATSWVVLEI